MIVAVGHHRDGIILAPATELVRDLVLQQTPQVEAAPFAPPKGND